MLYQNLDDGDGITRIRHVEFTFIERDNNNRKKNSKLK